MPAPLADPVKTSSLDAPRVIGALLAVSAVLKLYHLTAPVVDWQSWNQVTNLAIARYIYQGGWHEVFYPRIGLYTSLDLLSDKTFQEAPLLHLMMVGGYYLIGGEAEWVGRVFCIAFSALGGVYLYRLCRGRLPASVTFLALAIYAFSPMDLYFHRTVKSDVPFSSFMIVALFYFVRWLEESRPRHGLLAGASLGLAALFKPYALYMGAAFLFLVVRRQGWRRIVTPMTLAIGILCIAPVAAWLVFGAIAHPISPGEGGNLTVTTKLLGPWSALWSPSYYERLQAITSDLILTPIFALALYAIIGVAVVRGWRAWRSTTPVEPLGTTLPDWWIAWMLGVVVYLAVVRHGNQQHDYYQIPLLPPFAIGGALGFHWLWQWAQRGGLRGRYTLLQWSLLILAVLMLPLAIIRSYHKHALDIDSYHAGRAVAAARGPNDTSLSFDQGSLRFNQLMYYTDGKGWRMPASVKSYDDLKPYVELGARFIAITMGRDRWERQEAPLAALLQMEQAGTLKRVANSTDDKDRYGSPRHWAVFAIVPK